jgi:hypothetical protein
MAPWAVALGVYAAAKSITKRTNEKKGTDTPVPEDGQKQP